MEALAEKAPEQKPEKPKGKPDFVMLCLLNHKILQWLTDHGPQTAEAILQEFGGEFERNIQLLIQERALDQDESGDTPLLSTNAIAALYIRR